MGLGRQFLAPYFGWRAGQISDPVAKLRYLRARAPMLEPSSPRKYWLGGAMALGVAWALGAGHVVRPPAVADLAPAASHAPIGDVWIVESKPGFESYSNGLRIETGDAVDNGPRRGFVFDANEPARPMPLDRPAGIVYHTTESDIAPFRREESAAIQHLGESLIHYVARRQAYHYLIDRFGAVHRIVREASPANHAGFSLWGDAHRLYVNLNPSFLGVAFETRTEPGNDLPSSINPAQVHAAKVLTEMLRAKYHIAAENCVTHAQVSVNPSNLRVGSHTDWAANFPFGALGLPDNYEMPVAAIERFGFTYDNDFVLATGSRVWRGLLLSRQRIDFEAAQKGQTPAQLRAGKVELYHRLAALSRRGEYGNETVSAGH